MQRVVCSHHEPVLDSLWNVKPVKIVLQQTSQAAIKLKQQNLENLSSRVCAFMYVFYLELKMTMMMMMMVMTTTMTLNTMSNRYYLRDASAFKKLYFSVLSVTQHLHNVIMRPSYRLRYAFCPSVRLSHTGS